MKSVLSAFCILCALTGFSQIEMIDESRLAQHMDYLTRKLTYTYYNPELKNWWINKFSYDPETGLVDVRNTQAKNPRKVLGKKYIGKKFLLTDINPFTIEKVHLDHAEGRMVKGEEVILYTVKHKKLIRKTINTETASPQSFLHISIPGYMEDSTHISDSVILAFKESVFFATTLHRKENPQENMDIIFEALDGDHKYQNASGEVHRFTKQYNPYVLAFEDYQERHKIRDVLFGYDPEADRYYEMVIEENGEMVTRYFTIQDTDELVLTTESGDQKIIFENRSLYFYEIDGQRIDLETM